MPRFRRYRSFLTIAAVFVVFLFYLSSSSSPNDLPPSEKAPLEVKGPDLPPDSSQPEPPPAPAAEPPPVPEPPPPPEEPPAPPPPPPRPNGPPPPPAAPEKYVIHDPSPNKPAWKPDFPGANAAQEEADSQPHDANAPADAPPPPPPQPEGKKPTGDKQKGDSSKKEELVGEAEDLTPVYTPKGQGRVEVEAQDSYAARPHWRKLPEHFPIPADDMIPLPTGRPKPFPKMQPPFKDESSSQKLERLQRLAIIKKTFEHAWNGYKTRALGHDELRPVTESHRNPFNHWGATLVDALDTLWIMDMKTEFAGAVDVVKKIDFTTSARRDIPVFETAIRYLGGLLGAYDVSGHRYTVLLDKAVQLADILLGAFDTPNRMPVLYYDWAP